MTRLRRSAAGAPDGSFAAVITYWDAGDAELLAALQEVEATAAAKTSSSGRPT